jgi:hypothetical protein
MPDEMLPYDTEQFAKIAVANALWLIGEFLVHRDENWAEFAPEERYWCETRRFEESVSILVCAPEAMRHAMFVFAFRFRPYQGGHLFEQLVAGHPDLLDEALRKEWERRLARLR